MTDLQTRRRAYEALTYYATRAQHALDTGDMVAHESWARRYHNLRAALEG